MQEGGLHQAAKLKIAALYENWITQGRSEDYQNKTRFYSQFGGLVRVEYPFVWPDHLHEFPKFWKMNWDGEELPLLSERVPNCGDYIMAGPSYEKLLLKGKQPEFIADISVISLGNVQAVFEIVHKSGLSKEKKDFYNKLHLAWFEVPALQALDWDEKELVNFMFLSSQPWRKTA